MEPVHFSGPPLEPAPGRLLVAASVLGDPNFVRTLVLLIEVNDEGALGVVLNRPTSTTVERALGGSVEIAAVPPPSVIFEGGPVGSDTLLGVSLCDGEPALVDLEQTWGVAGRFRLFAGYAGWGAEELEGEIAEGSWYVVPGCEGDLLTEQPEELWRVVLARQIGIIRWLSTRPLDPEQN
mgnify:CR=1 FL=1